jgi:hypothetical protein
MIKSRSKWFDKIKCRRINHVSPANTLKNKKITSFLKMADIWIVAPCSLLEVHRCFRGAYCLHVQGYQFAQNFVIKSEFITILLC